MPLQSIRDDVRTVESKKLIHQIIKMSHESSPMGSCVIPVMVEDEYLVGVMLISDTDKLPHSVYRL